VSCGYSSESDPASEYSSMRLLQALRESPKGKLGQAHYRQHQAHPEPERLGWELAGHHFGAVHPRHAGLKNLPKGCASMGSTPSGKLPCVKRNVTVSSADDQSWLQCQAYLPRLSRR
jgi:hypothetical protein